MPAPAVLLPGVVLIAMFLLFPSLVTAQAWINQVSGTHHQLYSISYCDTLNGFAVGDSGVILHTTNGGAEWNSQSNPGGIAGSLRRVVATTPGRAYILGNTQSVQSSFVLRTTDGGATWSTVLDGIPLDTRAMSFANSNFGIVLGLQSLYVTTDGGNNWNSRNAPAYGLEDVSTRDARHVMASGWGGIMASNDSGNTWGQIAYYPVYYHNIELIDSRGHFSRETSMQRKQRMEA